MLVFVLMAKTSVATESQELTRTTSGYANELPTIKDGHLFLTIHDGSELDADRLLELKRLKGLKIERIGKTERIPGCYWLGGIGQSVKLSVFSASLQVLDLSLVTTSQTFKLSSDGSAFLRALVNLEELDLSNHYITTGASNLSGLTRLKRLSLRNNKIGTAIGDLKTLVNMEVLDLGNNSNMPMHLLKETLLAMPRLEEIDLTFHPGLIKSKIPESFDQQIAAGIRSRQPRLEISSAICPAFEEESIPCDGIISADDFLRELNHRLKREIYLPSRTLPREECVVPDCLVPVLSHKGYGQIRYQRVYDPEGILMKGKIFNPSDHNHLSESDISNGTSQVGFYSLDGKRVLCLKRAPESPGSERATHILNQTLFGIEDMGVPSSETIVMGNTVFTASSYVEGIGFDQVLRGVEAAAPHPAFIENLHQMKVLAMLARPEDGRAQNCICQKIREIDGQISYRLVSIDHDRCFGDATPHQSRRDPSVTVRGHSVMHCIPDVDPDYSDLKTILFSQTPKEVYEKWVAQIRIEDKYQRALTPFVKLTGNTRLGVPITETITRNLLEKLSTICDGLRESKTLEMIFSEVDPELAAVYHAPSLMESPVTPPRFLKRDDEHTPPRICLARAVKRIKRIDGGRSGPETPPSACCELFGDYLPPELVSREVQAAMWSPKGSSDSVKRCDDSLDMGDDDGDDALDMGDLGDESAAYGGTEKEDIAVLQKRGRRLSDSFYILKQ